MFLFTGNSLKLLRIYHVLQTNEKGNQHFDSLTKPVGYMPGFSDAFQQKRIHG